jgi:transglutaminase-like putative cysteine protease
MSRLEFRAAVAAPRPSSAWVLVSVASATLWITGQLDPWVLVVQPVLLVATLLRRTDPFAWQKSDVSLNVGMFAIVAVTIQVALRGGPSTIALAHFAALTQALQLLDARPRRTEFLLVALALFQVVLAANLTDSPWFPPLLVAFLLAVVWTLMVHTLRSEALEAGDPRSISRAHTPGLVRTTAVASVACVMLGMLLFMLLPRLRSSVIQGAGLGASRATAGFSDQVRLGELGRIRQDATVVMRVETLQGDPPGPEQSYWRGLAFDHFDGTSWSITPPEKRILPGSPEGGISVGADDRANLVQRIVREPVQAGALFGAGQVRGIQGTVRRISRDVNGGLYALGQQEDRLRYVVATWLERRDEGALRRDRAVAPRRREAAFLQLPQGSGTIAELARTITDGVENDADRMRALEQYLLQNGRYSDTPPRVPEGSGLSPIEAFLVGEMEAHCEYFATALVLMARSIGIPAQLVNGFAGGRQNRIGDFVELTRSDAHAWVEVPYEKAGWVRYDATPAALRARPEVALSWGERFRELSSAAELWWYQRVIGFDRSDQIQALRRAYFAWKGWGRRAGQTPAVPTQTAWRFEGGVDWTPLAWASAGVALCAWLLLRLRRRRPRNPLPAFYAEALRLLARRGLTRSPASTPRDFAQDVAAAHPGPAAAAFASLTESYLALRFGGHVPAEVATPLRTLREGLRRRRRTRP